MPLLFYDQLKTDQYNTAADKTTDNRSNMMNVLE